MFGWKIFIQVQELSQTLTSENSTMISFTEGSVQMIKCDTTGSWINPGGQMAMTDLLLFLTFVCLHINSCMACLPHDSYS